MKIIFLQFIAFFFLFACNKSEDGERNFYFDVIPMGENNVEIEWSEDESASHVRFTIDKTDQFNSPELVSEHEFSTQKLNLGGLEPMTNYFLKIEVLLDSKIIWTKTSTFQTTYTIEALTYESTGGIEICARLKYLSQRISPSSKRIIFMHEFGKTKASWGKTSIEDTLIQDGNLCVAFDFRGHGCSSFIEDKNILIEDLSLVREDLDATMAFLETLPIETSNEYIVIGASIGACVATAASSYPNVLGGVASSAVKRFSYSMLDFEFQPKGMYYIAGKLDKNEYRDIDYELDAQALYDNTVDPRQIDIIPKSEAHGVDLFLSNDTLQQRMIAWVRSL